MRTGWRSSSRRTWTASCAAGTLPEGAAEEAAVAAMAEVPEGTVNFKSGMGHISPVTIVQRAEKRPDKVFHANVISDGGACQIRFVAMQDPAGTCRIDSGND